MTDHLENAASGSGAAPVLFDLLSWFRQELPHLLQRLACIKPPPQTVEEVAAAAAEAGADEAAAAAAAAAAAVDGGSPNKEGGAARLLTTARVGTTAHESAAYARDSLAMRSLLESEVRREREAAEEAERERRWEQVSATDDRRWPLMTTDEGGAGASLGASRCDERIDWTLIGSSLDFDWFLIGL
jgi:hypothetical protein